MPLVCPSHDFVVPDPCVAGTSRYMTLPARTDAGTYICGSSLLLARICGAESQRLGLRVGRRSVTAPGWRGTLARGSYPCAAPTRRAGDSRAHWRGDPPEPGDGDEGSGRRSQRCSGQHQSLQAHGYPGVQRHWRGIEDACESLWVCAGV